MYDKLLIPPNYLEEYESLIFLAGPMTGAAHWQSEATKLIEPSGLYVASPRQIDGDDYFPGFEGQVDWELFHLEKAKENGCVLFWLDRENEHFCDRPFAQTSRIELGEAMNQHKQNGINMVVGFYKNFSGTRYLTYRLRKDCPDVPIFSTLEKTCEKAIELARK